MAFNKKSIIEMATKWYKMLDVHAPMVEFLPLLDKDENVKMIFPEGAFAGWAGYETWYQNVLRIFFDEQHTLKVCEPEVDGNTAKVKIVVQWEASAWDAPAPNSKRIRLEAFQTWIVVADGSDSPVVREYIVDDIKYLPGSAKL